jgi:mono/diheme cytochrome c family protein
MTRQRSSLACVALLLMAIHQQQPRLAAARAADPIALPVHLWETGLFAGRGTAAIAAGNRPFAPQYPLWTDGAAKRRWIHLPAGTTIDATNPREWEFPVGTRLWKEFGFGGRRVETRFLWKASATGWLAGSYLWNEEGTDAVLVDDDGVAGAMEIAPGRRHSIPSRGDCAACHGDERRPLGFNPLQLSDDRDPNAIHGEPLAPGMVTLQTLFDEHLLSGADPALRQTPPRIVADDPRTRAVLGYFAGNCGACHNADGKITARLPSFAYADITDGSAVTQQLAGKPSRWQAAGKTDGTMLIDPTSPESSAILVRMSSRRPSSQMPPLGSVLRDQQAIDAIRGWIATVAAARSLEPDAP